MGKTRYNKLKEFLERLKLERGNEISEEEFSKQVLMNIASDKRYLEPNMKLMTILNMVEVKNDRVIIA